MVSSSGIAGEGPEASVVGRTVSRPSEHIAAADRDRLVESHLPLVRAIARRYTGRGETLDDLVQVGSLGLIRASRRFEPDRGIAFATFVAPAIEGEIRRHLGDHAGALRIPRELQRMTGELRRRRQELSGVLGREPSTEELAEALGVQRGDVELALEAERARDQIPGSADELEFSTEYEFPSATHDRLSVADSARVLDERERRIVFLRFHADLTERDIAQELGLSQATVSRLLAGALDKLRDDLTDRKAADSDAGSGPDPAVSPGEDAGGVQEPAQKRSAPGPRAGGRSRMARVAASPQKASAGETAPQGQGSAPKASTPSGRFLVRMPSELHQELSQAAEREQVSLNRYVTQALAESVSPHAAAEADGADATRAAAPRRRGFRMLVAANLVVIVIAAAAAITLLVLALERGI